ncbi:MAG: serine/threonine protein kinase [Fuerstiella sp.]|nr:serine/threonine protein kinase [Fuerstiella sp.]MCP4856078.1 serine/threonine protein kinase [Fuerstiella sp.]
MVTNSLSEQLLNDLGEDFAERIRRGESPSVDDYAGRFPVEQTREVEEFLDSIAMIEFLKRGDDRSRKQPDAMPEEFGRYRIEQSLGEGGMGAVYLAHDSQLDRKVALKTPKFARNSDPNLIRRFYREARSAATLQHPNICPVYDVGEIGGIHYISMAYIEGRPLSDFIKSSAFPPVASVLRVVRKIAIALHEAHGHGVVHRDLKPANIMISRRNEPIIMDFGLARQFGTGEAEEPEAATKQKTTQQGTKKVEARLTLDGTVVGSPGYMSPEQLRGEHQLIGPSSDVYALGVLLYELLTRELPFPGDGSLMSIINAVISDDLPDASTVRPQLDSRVVAICQKAMAKNIGERYESMQTLAVALTDVLKSDTDDGASPGVPEVANLASSPELVRTKEQYELARSLYQEGQFTAAVSILEKMVAGAEQHPNQYTTWATSELLKARTRAEQASNEDHAFSAAHDDGFWDDDFGEVAVPTATYENGTTRTAKRRQRKKAVFSIWLYAVASAATIVIVSLIAMVISEMPSNNGESEQLIAEAINVSAADDESVVSRDQQKSDLDADNSLATDSTAETTDALRARPFGVRRPSPVERLWRLDTDGDKNLSRAEVNAQRMPEAGPLKQVADNFDDFDLDPRDGVLDRNEIQRVIRLMAKPGGRDYRGRQRPRP